MNNDNLVFGHKRLRDLGAANRFRVWQAVEHLGRESVTIDEVAEFTRLNYDTCCRHLADLGIRLRRKEYELQTPHDSIIEVDAFMSRPSDGLTLSDVTG